MKTKEKVIFIILFLVSINLFSQKTKREIEIRIGNFSKDKYPSSQDGYPYPAKHLVKWQVYFFDDTLKNSNHIPPVSKGYEIVKNISIINIPINVISVFVKMEIFNKDSSYIGSRSLSIDKIKPIPFYKELMIGDIIDFKSKVYEKDVNIQGRKIKSSGISESITNGILFEGKKNTLIIPDLIPANAVINNSREIMAKVPGLNIVENDGAGIQMGIGTRGLNPNRISEFNTRQNGYDIAADALGYPENYYTPPIDFVQEIDIIRGSAGLQFGPQFGGLINFRMKDGENTLPIFNEISNRKSRFLRRFIFSSKNKRNEYKELLKSNPKNLLKDSPFGVISSFKYVVGSHQFVNYQVSIQGQFKHHQSDTIIKDNRSTSFYLAWNNKSGNGWRDNSLFRNNTIFGALKKTSRNGKSILNINTTYMEYTMQQPGGLTDASFKLNAQKSVRDRSWFFARWFIPSFEYTYQINNNKFINAKVFSLIGERFSIGNLITPNQSDYKRDRNLITDEYINIGTELRGFFNYHIFRFQQKSVIGIRYYQGNTHRRQGDGDSTSLPNFRFNQPNNLEGSDFKFPSSNIAIFGENIFYILPNLSITPGVRMEYIQTNSNGYYSTDLGRKEDKKTSSRSFPLFGCGVSYKVKRQERSYGNIYANISQAYSAVNFNDLRVVNPSLRVDPNLKDVTGYNGDIGWRGNISNFISLDGSFYYMAYNKRIGVIYQVDATNFDIFRFRTNVADSRSFGFELYSNLDLFKLLKISGKGYLNIFNSFSYNNSKYINTPNQTLRGKIVEFSPEVINRSGIEYSYAPFQFGLHFSYTSLQFSDALNTKFSSQAIVGTVPAYNIMDINIRYKIGKRIQTSLSINNVLNIPYFTRRTDGYPGPGILPSDGRMFYFSVAYKM